jgi:TPR repeat protein
VKYCKLPADQGNSDRQYIYRLSFEAGQGMPWSPIAAAWYFQMSADQGNASAMENGADDTSKQFSIHGQTLLGFA